MKAQLKPGRGGLIFISSYDSAMLANFKAAVPPAARRWVPEAKHWLIDPAYGQAVANVVHSTLGYLIAVPQMTQAQPEIKILRLEYLGRPKDRGNGEMSAMGYVDDDWSVVFSLNVLKRWFTGEDARPGEETSLYGVLGLKQGALADDIKRAYRRMAKQWHPDVCREPDAAEQFRRLQAAYEVLSNDRKRRKYDAALKMLAGSQQPRDFYLKLVSDWTPPLRCGFVLAQGTVSAGRFVVNEILQWQDITRGDLVMTSYWPAGADKFVIEWV